MKFIDVVFDLPFYSPFTYSIDDSLIPELKVGARVLCQFGAYKENICGFVIKIHQEKRIRRKCKKIVELVDKELTCWDKELFKLFMRLSFYYSSPLGIALFHFLPPELKKGRPLLRNFGKYFDSISFKQVREAINLKDLSIDTNFREKLEEAVSSSSKNILLQLNLSLQERLILYSWLMANITQDKEVSGLILFPHPKLVSLISKEKSGFLFYHPYLSPKSRLILWSFLRVGNTAFVISSPSGIFLPLPKLKLIIIDSEHDPAYKQELSLPYYDCRKVAYLRAKLEDSKLILVSSHPSIEGYFQATTRKDWSIIKEEERIRRHITYTNLVYKRGEKKRTLLPSSILTSKLQHSLLTTLKKGKKAVLLLGYRGYARYLICEDCGYILYCNKCQHPLVYHVEEGTPLLKCHFCLVVEGVPDRCPHCSSFLISLRGVGTQYAQREVSRFLSNFKINFRVIRCDTDSRLQKSKVEEANVLIGTQLLLSLLQQVYQKRTKDINLVGILSVEALMSHPSFSLSEIVFHQIAELKDLLDDGGELIIQGYSLTSEVLILLQAFYQNNYSLFYDWHIKERKKFLYPPFCKLIKIRVIGPLVDEVKKENTYLERYFQRNLKLKNKNIIKVGLVERLPQGYVAQLFIKLPENISIFKIYPLWVKLQKRLIRRKKLVYDINVDAL
jgi:primosomal protein N' (replication factor Y)